MSSTRRPSSAGSSRTSDDRPLARRRAGSAARMGQSRRGAEGRRRRRGTRGVRARHRRALLQGADVRGGAARLPRRRRGSRGPRSTRSSAARRTSSRARRSSTSTCRTSSARCSGPVQTVAADGLFGVATGMMLIRSGARVDRRRRGAQQGLGRPDARRDRGVRARPGAEPAAAVPDARGRRARHERVPRTHRASSEEHCAMVAAKNRSNALDNPRAAYPADLDADDVDGSRPGRVAAQDARGRRTRRRLRRGRARRRGPGTRAHRGARVAARRRLVLGQPVAREPDVGRDRAGDQGRRARLPPGRDRRPAGGDRPRRGRRHLRVQGAAAPRGARARRGDGARRSCSTRASSNPAATCR